MPSDLSDKSVTFPGRFDSLPKIVEYVTLAAEAAGLDQRSLHAIQLAVDEACSNIIEHAYGGQGRGKIECLCRVESFKVTVILRDHGRAFDPNSIPEPDLQCSIEDRCEGGLGLFIMRQLMDEIDFRFDDARGNTLTMVKYREITVDQITS